MPSPKAGQSRRQSHIDFVDDLILLFIEREDLLLFMLDSVGGLRLWKRLHLLASRFSFLLCLYDMVWRSKR